MTSRVVKMPVEGNTIPTSAYSNARTGIPRPISGSTASPLAKPVISWTLPVSKSVVLACGSTWFGVTDSASTPISSRYAGSRVPAASPCEVVTSWPSRSAGSRTSLSSRVKMAEGLYRSITATATSGMPSALTSGTGVSAPTAMSA
jgi:hypothetical protein